MNRLNILVGILIAFASLKAAALDVVAVDHSPVAPVSNFAVTSQMCLRLSDQVVMIRKFDLANKTQALVVDPDKLTTAIVDFASLVCVSDADVVSKTTYGRLLEKARATDALKADSGITRSSINTKLFLTVDLCPSHKTYEQGFFDWVRAQKVPVAISISGAWMDQHKDELSALKDLEKTNSITWVNHTLTHPYIKAIADGRNFLLLPGVNVSDEIFGNERKMIENGLTPSVFFRFPGLISDHATNDEVESSGLIAIGSDAWLALGEKPKEGSIILVHGNGNEPYGIRLFFKSVSDFTKAGFAPLTSLESAD